MSSCVFIDRFEYSRIEKAHYQIIFSISLRFAPSRLNHSLNIPSITLKQGVGSVDGCEEDSLRSHCKSLKTCKLCRAHQHCDWQDQMCMVARNRTTSSEHLEISGENIPSIPPIDLQDHHSSLNGGTRNALHPHKPCEATCAERLTCSKCTEVDIFMPTCQ